MYWPCGLLQDGIQCYLQTRFKAEKNGRFFLSSHFLIPREEGKRRHCFVTFLAFCLLVQVWLSRLTADEFVTPRNHPPSLPPRPPAPTPPLSLLLHLGITHPPSHPAHPHPPRLCLFLNEVCPAGTVSVGRGGGGGRGLG